MVAEVSVWKAGLDGAQKAQARLLQRAGDAKGAAGLVGIS